MRSPHAAGALAVFLHAATLRADPLPDRRIELGASLGYDAPTGSTERGSRTSDGTIGAPGLQIDASCRFTTTLGFAIAGRYGVGIPTLCQNSSDCISSLGSDVALSLRARYFLPRVGSVSPRVDAGLGYEWLTTRLIDSGATSTRAYDGPTVFLIEAAAPFRLGTRWALGPTVGASAGTFIAHRLESGPISIHEGTRDRAVHGWLSIALRIGFTP